MTWIVLAYHLASRLAYVLYVGLTLNRQDRTAYLTRRYGAEAGFWRFRRMAAFVMANDAVSFGVLCLVSASMLRVGLPRGLEIAVGAGPYRWLKNPMYTVGYLPVYGLALATASLVGLVAALFDQCAILTFYHLVEKPHFERVSQAPSEPVVKSAPGSAHPPSLDTAPGQPP